MAHRIALNSSYCLPGWLWKDDAHIHTYICVCVCMCVHTRRDQQHKGLLDTGLSGNRMTIDSTWFSLLQWNWFIYFWAGEAYTSLECLHFDHHSVADQQLNLYRRFNSRWHSLMEHIFIPILIIRVGFGLHAFSMQYQVQGPNPYF